jgi:hypothetical protein
LPWLLWLTALLIFVAVWLFPISNFLTRSSGIVLLTVVWCGLIVLTWRSRAFRLAVLTITAACVIFFFLPARNHRDIASLRSDYVAGLRHYEGVNYYWGGESPKGIDCSGLIRRGLIDSLFLRGIRSFDAGLVRHAIWLWWHDCTARDLGDGYGVTIHLLDTPSINTLDHSKLLPGDLGVTRSGVHIMAYLGDESWIEADPSVARVIRVSVPSRDNVWFQEPMSIVRWNILRP